MFNGERFLPAAIDSLLAQDHGDLELVINDNASTDATAAICEDYARRDPRVRFSRHAENLGPNRNFMRVLELATGDHFMWAAHDDLWAPDYLSRLLPGFDAGDRVVLVAGRTAYVEEDGRATEKFAVAPPAEVLPAHELMARLFAQQASSWFYGVYRRAELTTMLEFLRTVPVWGGDMLFLSRCCLNYQVVGNDNAVIYKRLRAHTYHFPKTPRAWVRWQAVFASSLLREVVSADQAWREKAATLAALQPHLAPILFKKGARGTARMWLRAAYHWSQGRDHG